MRTLILLIKHWRATIDGRQRVELTRLYLHIMVLLSGIIMFFELVLRT